MATRHALWLLRVFLGSLALAIGSVAAKAGDYYVDAAHGDNANSGASPQQAWRTITFAVNATPLSSVAEVIHVAPGVYDSALGEVFPLYLMFHPTVQIVGTGGRDVTILDGGGTGTLVFTTKVMHVGFSDPLQLVQGVTLQNAVSGLAVSTSWGAAYMTCRDVKFTRMSGWAITLSASSANLVGNVQANFERVEVSDCRGAIDASAGKGMGNPHVDLVLVDCKIARNASEGILLADYMEDASTLVCKRTIVTDNQRCGIRMSKAYSGLYSGGTTAIDLSDCSITRNGRGGVKGEYSGVWAFPNANSFVHASIRRCTIADNTGIGLDMNLATIDPARVSTSLEGTILFGNIDDVSDIPTLPSIANPTFNDVGDGDFAGTNGNVSIDPRFVDSPSSDYRLRFGSPCIETGDPATPLGTLDLAKNARPIDGDLDTHEAFDIGAYEHAPLFLVSTGQLGTPLKLQCFGQNGGTTTVSFSRLAPVAPISTPFGEFDLNQASVGLLFTSAVASGPPIVFARPIPNNAALVGRTFSFQGKSSSSAAPLGFAYTNVVSITIVP